MKTSTDTTRKTIVAISVLVLLLFTAACYADTTTDIATTTPEPAPAPTPSEQADVPNTSSATTTTEDNSYTRWRENLDDCQRFSGISLTQASRDAETLYAPLAELFPDIHAGNEKARSRALTALSLGYGACGIPFSEVSALAGQGELGTQYRKTAEAVGSASHTDFIEVFQQQPCLAGIEWGFDPIADHDPRPHILALNLAALLNFMPTDDEMLDIAIGVISNIYGTSGPNELLYISVAASRSEGQKTCEEFTAEVQAIKTEPQAAAATP